MSSSIITLGEKSNKLLYPLLASISHFLYEIGNLLLSKKANNSNGLGKHEFVLSWILFLSEAIIIFLYFLETKLSKLSKNCNEQTNFLFSFLLILLCFILHFLLNIVPIFFSLEFTKNDLLDFIINILSMISMSIFSIFILHYKYYQHHFIGVLIVFIGIIIHALFLSSEHLPNTFLNSILIIIIYVISSLIEVIEKYLIDIQYINPYLIISLQGIIGVVVIGILLLIFNNIPCPKEASFCEKEKMIEDFNETMRILFSNKESIIGIILMFFGICGFNIFRMKTIQIYSPTHRVLTNIITSFLHWIFVDLIFYNYFEMKLTDTLEIIIVKLISYFISLIGLSIFLEIIIINAFNLNRNTNKAITERIDKELEPNLLEAILNEPINDLIENERNNSLF